VTGVRNGIELRASFEGAMVDPTEARKSMADDPVINRRG
jgi:hypothetical protein